VLAQLASKMDAAGPFDKVKALIANMIEKLLSEAQADATEKAFCDKEMAETEAKQTDKEDAITKLSTSIDSMTAKAAQLNEQVAVLQKELAEVAKAQAEMDKLRAEEKAAFDKNSAEMKKGINGVQLALKVLNDYYAKDSAHASAEGAATGIIGLLEVVESDFSKGLAEMTAVEENAQATYDAAVKENEIEKTIKDQDVKYKSKEATALDKAVSEQSNDRTSEQAELDAVVEYLGKLNDMCVAKAEPYAEKAARREAEIAGLKEALEVLSGEAVLLQQARSLRGVHRH